MAWYGSSIERLAMAVHAVHGSRGIYLGALGFLLLAWVEPALPRDVDLLLLATPILLVFATGLGTLPREGVAAQARALAVIDMDQGWRPMARRLLWPALLCLLLAPRIFLAAYGIPHMNPLTGIITPAVQRQLTLTFLFGVLLLPAIYLRSSRRYAPDIVPQRPAHLEDRFQQHERDLLLWLSLVILLAWLWLLYPFWAPFSLFDWPMDLSSLRAGARGVGSVAFAVTIPLVLWMSLNAHLGLLRALWRRDALSSHRLHAAMAGLHVLLVTGAVVLHVYDLLWIAQYRSAVGF